MQTYCVGSDVLFSLPCVDSGSFAEPLHRGTTHPKTESHIQPLSSHSRRRRQLKVEYEQDDRVKTELWEPPDWRKQLGYIREMRSSRDAPVDNMGAEKCYDTEAPAHVCVFNYFFFLKST